MDHTKVVRAVNQTANCQPNHCKSDCVPACSALEKCARRTMQACGQCSSAECVRLTSVNVASLEKRKPAASTTNTALIAGLTTGLVVAAILATALVGYVYLRRRRHRTRAKSKSFPSILPQNVTVQPSTNSEPPSIGRSESGYFDKPLPVLNLQGKQVANESSSVGSLHMAADPRTLQPPLSAGIRHSLNMGLNLDHPVTLNRSSSVKVTKYDHLNSYLARENQYEDLEDEKVQIRRAVSVKKPGNSMSPRSASLGTSAGSRLQAESLEDLASTDGTQAIKIMRAKPTMVRINVVTSNEGGVTRKKSVRTAITPKELEEQIGSAAESPGRDIAARDHKLPLSNISDTSNISAQSAPGDIENTVDMDSSAKPTSS